jgi:hypothetical protein
VGVVLEHGARLDEGVELGLRLGPQTEKHTHTQRERERENRKITGRVKGRACVREGVRLVKVVLFVPKCMWPKFNNSWW